MKIRSTFILCLIACMLFAGCTAGGNSSVITQDPGSNQQTAQTKPATEPTTEPTTEPQPQKRELTLEEVNDYFMFTTSASDVTKSDEPLGNERGKGKLTVTVGCKKRAEFEGVVLTVSLVTNKEYGWPNLTRELQLSYDGKCEQIIDISSYIVSYVTSTPKYTVEVTAVSGYVIE